MLWVGVSYPTAVLRISFLNTEKIKNLSGMKADDSFVQFGIIDADSLDNVYGIKEFLRHPNYVGIEGKTANDIAVLKVYLLTLYLVPGDRARWRSGSA